MVKFMVPEISHSQSINSSLQTLVTISTSSSKEDLVTLSDVRPAGWLLVRPIHFYLTR
jgi:hypothetical protein